jgi:hypothetical protein
MGAIKRGVIKSFYKKILVVHCRILLMITFVNLKKYSWFKNKMKFTFCLEVSILITNNSNKSDDKIFTLKH